MLDWFFEFAAMGGYARFIWLSYGAVGALFCWHYFAPRMRDKKLRAQLRRELHDAESVSTVSTVSTASIDSIDSIN